MPAKHIYIERNINRQGDAFVVNITRRQGMGNYTRRGFATLPEAREHRDAMEAQHPPAPSGFQPRPNGPMALGKAQYQKLRRARMHAAGLCPACGGENPPVPVKRTLCRECREVQALKRRALRTAQWIMDN
jgi:hypothetical protein